ncbi:MAG: AI-2E family transporter [Pyrinomonadaceae bacterium]
MAARVTRENTYTERVLIAIGLVLAVLLCLTLVYFAFDILMLVFAAALLAIFLRGLAEILRRWIPISEGPLVLIVALLLAVIVAGAVALLAPSVAEQVRLLRVEIPKSAVSAGEYISQFGWGQTLLANLPSSEDVMARLDPSTVLNRVGGYFSSTVGVIGNILITFLVAIYLASEPQFYAAGFTRLFPLDKRQRVAEVLDAVYETLRWWLIGKAGSMLFIGLLTWIGLSILGIPLALTLGLLAGLLSFIPNFGPIISAIPALLLAFIASPISALYVLALYGGVQIVESNVVTPFIERKTVELPPALTIVFQLSLGALIGGLGLVLATPLLAVVVVLVKMVYIDDVLGDDLEELPAENEAEKDKPHA